MRDETIDERIERLKKELDDAFREKADKHLLKPGTKVFVIGEIEEVDAIDNNMNYLIVFKKTNERWWFSMNDVVEAK